MTVRMEPLFFPGLQYDGGKHAAEDYSYSHNSRSSVHRKVLLSEEQRYFSISVRSMDIRVDGCNASVSVP